MLRQGGKTDRQTDKREIANITQEKKRQTDSETGERDRKRERGQNRQTERERERGERHKMYMQKEEKNKRETFCVVLTVCVRVCVFVAGSRGCLVQRAVDVVHEAVEMLREAAQFAFTHVSETRRLPGSHVTRIYRQNHWSGNHIPKTRKTHLLGRERTPFSMAKELGFAEKS